MAGLHSPYMAGEMLFVARLTSRQHAGCVFFCVPQLYLGVHHSSSSSSSCVPNYSSGVHHSSSSSVFPAIPLGFTILLLLLLLLLLLCPVTGMTGPSDRYDRTQ